MYHARLRFAVVGPARQWSVFSTLYAMSEPLQTLRYTGPSLQSVLAPQYPDATQHTLAVLEVPGLPEVSLLPSLAKYLL